MKVIYESLPNTAMSTEESIDRQIKLLEFLKHGCSVQVKTAGSWVDKQGTVFQPKVTGYRVLEKPKEVTVYTIIYWSKNFGVRSWSTQSKDEYEIQLSAIDQLNTKLLKTHIDKFLILE